jgi:hypothetical protein
MVLKYITPLLLYMKYAVSPFRNRGIILTAFLNSGIIQVLADSLKK